MDNHKNLLFSLFVHESTTSLVISQNAVKMNIIDKFIFCKLT